MYLLSRQFSYIPPRLGVSGQEIPIAESQTEIAESEGEAAFLERLEELESQGFVMNICAEREYRIAPTVAAYANTRIGRDGNHWRVWLLREVAI